MQTSRSVSVYPAVFSFKGEQAGGTREVKRQLQDRRKETRKATRKLGGRSAAGDAEAHPGGSAANCCSNTLLVLAGGCKPRAKVFDLHMAAGIRDNDADLSPINSKPKVWTHPLTLLDT